MPVGKRGSPRSPYMRHDTNDTLGLNCPNIQHSFFPLLQPGDETLHLFSFFLGVGSTCVQFLNLYKTVWWTPKSTHRYALNFDFINPVLFLHILFMLGLPPVYSCYKVMLSSAATHRSTIRLLLAFTILGVTLYTAVITGLGVNGEQLSPLPTPLVCIALAYMPVCSLIVHRLPNCTGIDLSCLRWRRGSLLRRGRKSLSSLKGKAVNVALQPFQFLGSLLREIFMDVPSAVSKCPGMGPTCCLYPLRYLTVSVSSNTYSGIPNSPPTSQESFLSTTAYFLVDPSAGQYLLPLQHRCSGTDVQTVRDEVELFRRDFNARLTDCLYSTTFIAYYSTVLPILFTQPDTLLYDHIWCLQQCVVTAICAFLFHYQRLLPPSYLDHLHRSAMHLGAWKPYSSRLGQNQPTVGWSSAQNYPPGFVIRHMRGLYRAVGINNAAEPGNPSHYRFYLFFYAPLQLATILVSASVMLVLYQTWSLNWVFEWYKLIGLGVMAFFSMVNLFYLLRSYLLLQRVYDPEVDTLSNITKMLESGSYRRDFADNVNTSNLCQ